MHYTITNKHINHYVEHGFIEFEKVIEPNLLTDAKDTLSTLTNSPNAIENYREGRDLFRRDISFEKISKHKSIAQTARELTKATKLYLAFDQIYTTCNIFEDSGALEKYFSFQDLSCIAILKLDNITLEYSDQFQVPTQFSNAVFINPKKEFDLRSLKLKNQCLFFIGYGNDRTIYIHNSKDVNNFKLKDFDYNFGDRLKKDFHPIVA